MLPATTLSLSQKWKVLRFTMASRYFICAASTAVLLASHPFLISGGRRADHALHRIPSPTCRSYASESPTAPERICGACLLPESPRDGPSAILSQNRWYDESTACARSGISGTAHRT